LSPESVYWFEQSPRSARAPLTTDLSADAVVVGGGIAGLAAAERLAEEGLDVVLLEAAICGSGATGRSSGFITPDSELQVADLCRRFGDAAARDLYGAVRTACEHIGRVVAAESIACDEIRADSLYAGLGPASIPTIRAEHEARHRLGFDSAMLLGDAVGGHVGTQRYSAAVRYSGTFGINGAALAGGWSDALTRRGVRIFEQSRVVRIEAGVVRTAEASVRAPRMIVALDRFAPELSLASRALNAARAYLLLSEPLPDAVLARLFPSGPLMVWDTDLIYQYFRPTREGRLLIGGGTLRRTYSRDPDGDEVHRKLARYVHETFPFLRDIRYTHRWHGQIGVTKDILPLAGASPDLAGVWYALGGAGLPWSVLGGWVAAEMALGRMPAEPNLLDPARAFTTIDPLQPLLGKRLTWMLSYLLARRFETGGTEQVRRRQQRLLTGVAASVAAAAVAAVRGRGGDP
jgi:gamma-glutamylputrescine oxidase